VILARSFTRTSALIALLALAACGEVELTPGRGPSADSGLVMDADARDASAADLGATDAGVADLGAVDAGESDAGPRDAGLPPEPTRYTSDARHSPLSPYVAAELARIRSNDPTLREDVLAKVGDSITVSTGFLHCFAGSRVNLDGRDALADTVAHFGTGDAAGTSPYTRTSLAAGVGWSAWSVLEGTTPPRVVQELDAIRPAFAVVMFGTNDIGANTPTRYADNLLDLVDTLTARGVVPIVSTFPPRDDNATADARVPLYKAIVRAVAEARQVPYVDFHGALLPLPGHGLGSDGVHPNTASSGACDLRAAGLAYGYNGRNLVTLEALDRTRRVVAGEAPPDDPGPRRMGAGTTESPFIVDALPFTDVRNTAFATERTRTTYTGCSATANEGGPEYVYTLSLGAPRRVDVWLFDRGTVDVDVHVLDATGTPAGCLARNDTHVSVDLGAGTWTIVLDTYVSGGVERAGEYLLVVL
jgi:lysophospholipase L1-like esterase